MAPRIGAQLTQTRLTAQPGGVGSTATLALRNEGPLVDQFEIQVEGLEPAWVSIPLPLIGLFPGDQQELQLVLSAPADAPAGSHPFQVVVTSQADPSVVARLDATLDVAEIGTLSLALVPLRQYAFRRATYTLQLGNRGNTNRLVQLVASDADEALRFELPTDQVLVRPGQDSVVPLRVRPRKTTWRGAEESLFFYVSALPAQDLLAPPLARASGELVRRSLAGALLALPVALKRAALIGLPLLLAALIGLFFLGQAGQQLPATTTAAGTPTVAPVAAGGGTPTPATSGGGGAPTPIVAPTPASAAVAAEAAPPIIARFGLELPADEAPAFLPLDWDVRGATTTQLSRSPNDTGPSRGEADIESADYTLTAANDDGTTSQTMRVYVLRPPVITDFEASAVQVGDTVTLTWRTDRANRVYLNDRLLDGSEGSLEMPADPHAPYVLRAENVVGQDVKALELTVVPTPVPTDEPTPAPVVVVTPNPIAPPPAVVAQPATVVPLPPPPPPPPAPPVDDATPEPTVVPDVTVTPEITPEPPTEVPTVVTPDVPPTVVTPAPVETTVPGCTTKFQPLNFTATTNGNNVDLKWSTSGGCAPYNGDIKAVYTYNGSDKDFAASSLSGTGTDTPPAGGCGSPNQINYTLSLKDTNGLTVSASATASLQHDCTTTNNPPSPPPTIVVTAIPGKPTIAGARTPPPNAAGWNNTDVTVTFTCADSTANITSCGPSPKSLTTEGANQTVTGTAQDDQNLTATATVTAINIDKTPPTTTASLDRTPNANGWIGRSAFPPGTNTFAVNVALAATDQANLSGVKSITFSAAPACPTCGGQTIAQQTVTAPSASVAISTEGQTTISYFATDVADNVEKTKTITVKLDVTPPTIAVTNVSNATFDGPIGASVTVSSIPSVITLTATDAPAPQAGSGLQSITFSATGAQTIASTTVNANASPATTNVTINTDGTTRITFSTVDKAGNTGNGTFAVTVTRPRINAQTQSQNAQNVSVVDATVGNITSSPAGLNCAGANNPGCTSAFNPGQITLTAHPIQGFGASWTGDVPAACQSSATCVVQLQAGQTLNVVAHFGVIIN